jgi:hypothetical protein
MHQHVRGVRAVREQRGAQPLADRDDALDIREQAGDAVLSRFDQRRRR